MDYKLVHHAATRIVRRASGSKVNVFIHDTYRELQLLWRHVTN